MRPPRSLAALLRGPLPALPRPLDAASERWAGLPPRVRALVACVAVAAAVGVGEARVSAAAARWGGASADVLVAAEHLAVGAPPRVLPATLPEAVAPPGALDAVPDDAVLALALPEGAVLTEAHLDPAGPAAGLAEGLRVVPFPVDRGAGIAAGGWVDVWVLGTDGAPATQIARGRPVLELADDDVGRPTALVGLGIDEVGPATTGIALGRVLLAHAPRP